MVSFSPNRSVGTFLISCPMLALSILFFFFLKELDTEVKITDICFSTCHCWFHMGEWSEYPGEAHLFKSQVCSLESLHGVAGREKGNWVTRCLFALPPGWKALQMESLPGPVRSESTSSNSLKSKRWQCLSYPLCQLGRTAGTRGRAMQQRL